ncbi:MAG: GTP-binding protein [Clostridia bacterium]|nr:GTP-binding protein [Clostridia bacterium]
MAEGPDIMESLPIILITGFLGAGKTTFLNNLLAHLRTLDKSTALLINEFGKAGIDKDLVDSRGEAVYEVNQGSIFCVCTRDQFIRALDGIAGHSPSFDLAVIESTGIANTADLGKYLEAPPLEGQIDIKQNFCLIDAANFHKVFETLPAVRTQVGEASVLVINKTDLVDKNHLTRLEARLRELNPDALILRTSYGNIDFSANLDLTGSWSARAGLDTSPPEDIFSATLVEPGLLSKEKVRRFLERHDRSLLRAKGFLATDEGRLFIEWVGGSLYIKPAGTDAGVTGTLVLIGYGLSEASLKDEFRECLL